MSAFICSDKHFAVVAKTLFGSPREAQHFADALKRENIKSVNHRYNERFRFRSVNLDAATKEDTDLYWGHDILVLLNCIDYQSCEHPGYDLTRLELAQRWLRAIGSTESKAKPNLWAI